MDFINGLPLTQGKNVITADIDRSSKYGDFILLVQPLKTTKIAQTVGENVFEFQ